ncbi:AfsR/SARP family transcriptional regulator [Thermanaerovibrio acidaminovorans]|uniref:Transcriptional regulator, SARP family n=1 Tax=Thermanaerovibrio acidaminovorans (strain ATCC 49978 / DSM 6589 / Su883) TaxID=525903 RepID=D1B770_THEAS|nr:BTAD domain-containing putative transcriptional regulator [Thermanaerovibrio acidaminovorans]ACZ19861.1 transcriptional regulator, SARP family [Thermanaerovibrio acidaminovorans DSM 6589]
MLKVNLAGPPHLELNGERVRFPFRKLEAMAYMLFDQGSMLRDRLCHLLWEDKPQASARKNLRNAVYVLRRILPQELVELDRDVVVLDPSGVELDLDLFDRFDRISDDDRDGLGREFLEGFELEGAPAFGEWLRERRREHARRFVSAARDLGEHLLGQGDFGGATRWFERAFQMDPLDEASARRLMELYHRSGWSAGPAEVFETLRSRLEGEYGLSPSAETVELYERIRSSRPTVRDFHAIAPMTPGGSPRRASGAYRPDLVWAVTGPSALDAAREELGGSDDPYVSFHYPSPSCHPLVSALRALKVDVRSLSSMDRAEEALVEAAGRLDARLLVHLRGPLGDPEAELLGRIVQARRLSRLGLLIASPLPEWLGGLEVDGPVEAHGMDPGVPTDPCSVMAAIAPEGATGEEMQSVPLGGELISQGDPMGRVWFAPRDARLRDRILAAAPEGLVSHLSRRALKVWLGRALLDHLDWAAWRMGAFHLGLAGDEEARMYCWAMEVRARLAMASRLSGCEVLLRPPSREEVEMAKEHLSRGGEVLLRIRRLVLD